MIDNSGQLRDEQIATLTQAVGAGAAGRVPLEVTLAALAEDRDDPRLAKVAQRLSAELTRGVPLDEAVQALGRQLPTEVQGLLRAGVASGDMAGTFERFADQRLAAQRLRGRIRAAVAYPLLILALLVPLILFISLYVVPMFRDLYTDFDVVLPPMTMLVLVATDQLPGLVGGILLFVVAVPVVLRIFGGRWLFHRVRSTMPLLGRLWIWSAQREFAALLASFLDLRLPITSAIAHTGEVISDRNMARACRRLSGRLQSGQPLSRCLSQSIHFDRSLVALVAWGESQGLLAESLRIATEMFDDRIEQHATLIRRLLPPVALILVGVGLFFLIVGLMVPLVELIQSLM